MPSARTPLAGGGTLPGLSPLNKVSQELQPTPDSGRPAAVPRATPSRPANHVKGQRQGLALAYGTPQATSQKLIGRRPPPTNGRGGFPAGIGNPRNQDLLRAAAALAEQDEHLDALAARTRTPPPAECGESGEGGESADAGDRAADDAETSPQAQSNDELAATIAARARLRAAHQALTLERLGRSYSPALQRMLGNTTPTEFATLLLAELKGAAGMSTGGRSLSPTGAAAADGGGGGAGAPGSGGAMAPLRLPPSGHAGHEGASRGAHAPSAAGGGVARARQQTAAQLLAAQRDAVAAKIQAESAARLRASAARRAKAAASAQQGMSRTVGDPLLQYGYATCPASPLHLP